MVDWESFYASFRRPDFIPGYEIQSHLGGGAFGEVYKAEKTSIGKLYAIKFLRLEKEGATRCSGTRSASCWSPSGVALASCSAASPWVTPGRPG